MQNAVAEQRVQDNALSGTTTISLRDTGPAGPKQARPEIEVIPEVSHGPGPISEADAVFCRDLLEFLGDFKSVAPKSSTVRRLGQAAVQNEPVARDLAPHQDLLFDFLRAYEAAPKMRPLSQRRLAGGRPEAAAKGPGQIAATPTVAEPEDTPFRVPPYVSSVSENTGTEEALLDADAAWLEPQASPEPVADAGRLQCRSQCGCGAARPGARRTAACSSASCKARPEPSARRKAARPSGGCKAARPSAGPHRDRPQHQLLSGQIQSPLQRRPQSGKLRSPLQSPAAKPLGPAAARAKAIAEGLIV